MSRVLVIVFVSIIHSDGIILGMVEQKTAGQIYLSKISDLLNAAKNQKDLYRTIVNAPFHDPLFSTQLDLGVVVLLLVNDASKTIDRIALSDTYSANGAVRMSPKPFKEIRIPINNSENIIAQAIKSKQPKQTRDWKDLFVPDLTPQEARFNQAGAGIECSIVYPLSKDKVTGALIFSMYQPLDQIDARHHDFMSKFAALVESKIS